LGKKLQALKETYPEAEAVLTSIYNRFKRYLRRPTFPKIPLPHFLMPKLPRLDDSDILYFSGITLYFLIICFLPLILSFYFDDIGVLVGFLSYPVTIPVAYAVFKWFMKASEKLY